MSIVKADDQNLGFRVNCETIQTQNILVPQSLLRKCLAVDIINFQLSFSRKQKILFYSAGSISDDWFSYVSNKLTKDKFKLKALEAIL